MFRNIFDKLKRTLNKPDFEIRIVSGKAELVSGKIRHVFVKECNELCSLRGIRKGNIYGVKQNDVIRLEFSPSFPKEFQQTVRNLWSIYKS